MNTSIFRSARSSVLFLFLLAAAIAAKEPPGQRKDTRGLAKSTGMPQYGVLNINNITTWARYDGHSNHSPAADDGTYFPRGTGSVIYQDCVVWGAKAFVDPSRSVPAPRQTVRVGGGSYLIGTRAGSVNGSGESATAESVAGAGVKIWRIRRDFSTLSEVELIRDAASVNEINELGVTQPLRDALITEYANAWTNWPVAKGAPYIERNGISGYQAPPPFSPTFTADSLVTQGFDEPGVAGADPSMPADQVLWMVYNDLNVASATSFVGSEPLGLEIQKTVWGYKRNDELGNIYFNRYRLINKGGVDVDAAPGDQLGAFYLDSVYVCQWSDGDLGDAGDDLIGCDTTLSLGFTYNATAVDAEFRGFQLAPPAVGYDFLAGPIVSSPVDSGVFDLKRRLGSKNLGMSSFAYFSAGSPYTDPPSGSANYLAGTGQWWKMLRGFAPLGTLLTGDEPYVHDGWPATKYPLWGDPVSATGFLDGKGTSGSFPPGDRRVLLTAGPFMLFPGDTQEVYVGVVGGLGADHLSSVAALKSNDRVVQSTFNSLFKVPKMERTVEVRHPTTLVAEIVTRVIPSPVLGVQGVTVNFEPEVGSEEPFSVILFDDGAHGDDLSGDGVWANTIIIATRKHSYRGRVTLQTATGTITDDASIADQVLRPTPILSNWRVVWEDGNQDRKVNPNESVFLRFDLQNGDGVNSLDQLTISNLSAVTSGYGSSVSPAMPIGPSVFVDHDALTFSYRQSPLLTPAIVGYSIVFDGCIRSGTVTLPVEPWIPPVTWRDTLDVLPVSGPSANVIPIVADSSLMTGHSYLVSFETINELTGEVGWSLKDANINASILTGQPLWAGDGPWPHPVVDGVQFVVRRAPNAFTDFQQLSDGLGPLNPPHFASFGYNGMPTTLLGQDRPTLDASGGRWGITSANLGATNNYAEFVSQVTLGGDRWPLILRRDWEIRFTAGPNYGLQPGSWSGGSNLLMTVPFELWNIGETPADASDDVRLFPYLKDTDADGVFDLAKVDNSASSSDNDPESDWISWIDPKNTTPGRAGYDAILTSVQADVAGHVYLDPLLMSGEVLRRMVLVNFNGGSVSDPSFPANIVAQMPATGSVFRIMTTKPNKAGDIVMVNTVPTSVAGDGSEVPEVFDLAQNYPNPFNPTTTIRFVIPARSVVTLEIYDLLGRKIRTLVHQPLDAGSHVVEWDGRSSAGTITASGVYFYRLTAGQLQMSKKMALMK